MLDYDQTMLIGGSDFMKTFFGWMMLGAWLLTVASAVDMSSRDFTNVPARCDGYLTLRPIAVRPSILEALSIYRVMVGKTITSSVFVAQQNGARNPLAALSDQHGPQAEGWTNA